MGYGIHLELGYDFEVTIETALPPHPMYEAWQVRGPRELLIVCSPGGDYLAVWKPEGES
jgi:hypothetical protein